MSNKQQSVNSLMFFSFSKIRMYWWNQYDGWVTQSPIYTLRNPNVRWIIRHFEVRISWLFIAPGRHVCWLMPILNTTILRCCIYFGPGRFSFYLLQVHDNISIFGDQKDKHTCSTQYKLSAGLKQVDLIQHTVFSRVWAAKIFHL